MEANMWRSEPAEPEPEVLVTVSNHVLTIKFNRPNKYNAITLEMYSAVASAVNEAQNDPNINIIVLTGSGSYFTAGNDFQQTLDFKDSLKNDDEKDPTLHDITKKMEIPFNEFVTAFIDCKKPIIALVNGPAIGIGTTILGLCDASYCTENAFFTAPFSLMGVCPEACSSYIFPKIMGPIRASQLLMFNRKISSAEARDWGLVGDVLRDPTFEAEAWFKVQEMSNLAIRSMIHTKELIRGPEERAMYHLVKKNEWDRLAERMNSPEFHAAFNRFINRKN